jgi:hypothetical protein
MLEKLIGYRALSNAWLSQVLYATAALLPYPPIARRTVNLELR